MIKTSTGWLFIGLLFLFFSFLIVEVTAEVKDVQTLSEVLDGHVKLNDITLSTNSTMYDRNGRLISTIYKDENRIYLPYDEIPKSVIDAFISTEDKRFFEHKGYDAAAIVRAFLINAEKGTIEEGASTMTQQLVRNVFLGHEQTYNRKMSELLYAHEVEKHYSKQEIFELYVNSIYFNNQVYGFGAASHFYFNKKSKDLSLAEIAFLSAIPNNPTHYDPLKNSEKTKLRQQWILNKMLEAGKITADEHDKAIAEPIVLNIQKRVDKYPDYVTYIHYELTELVSVSEGFDLQLSQAASEDAKQAIKQRLDARVQSLLEQGLQIETALEPSMQQKVIESFNHHLRSDVQGSGVVIDNQNAEIIAISGGKDFKKFDFHRGFQSYRQPGSAIKPLLVYAPYFEELDIPIQSKINANNFCQGSYCPKNFGGGQYGMVSISTAFKNSYNTPAIRILDRVGIETAFTYLEKLPFKRISTTDYQLPAALGGLTHGFSPLELTRAYTTFAYNGSFIPSYGIRQVKDRNGDILYSWDKTAVTMWSQGTNDKMRHLLSTVVDSGTGTKARISAPYVGGKTGTTNDFHDLWFVGLTDRFTAGVWIGKDTPSELSSLYKQAPHLQIWKEIMQ
ncbi:transglycosylase domain-containing protein [Halalkalibacter urbisdiaboli]|uniref:transglycosylase domain-containing protein n=1 Tax=Halalkalibacter urbisdiaboli TaxID=1960589 RepID=UPI000B4326F2|nr:transglycosylase domain-containing protein [Halalkalibacter urbisdiaboli]